MCLPPHPRLRSWGQETGSAAFGGVPKRELRLRGRLKHDYMCGWSWVSSLVEYEHKRRTRAGDDCLVLRRHSLAVCVEALSMLVLEMESGQEG